MKIIKYFTVVLCILSLASCNNTNENLQKIIPADAAGVVCIDVNKIIEKGQFVKDDKFELPSSLSEVVDQNDSSPLCQLLVDVPLMGVNLESKVYAFFTIKTFGSVFLVALDDESAAREIIERRMGSDFKQVDGLDCIYIEDSFYAISDKVLFMGKVNKPMDVAKIAKAANRMLSRTAASIVDDDEVMACIEAENDVNAYMRLDGLKLMLKNSKTYRDISSKMPLIDIFTESDIQAYIASINFNDDKADMDIKIKVDDNSEYVKLLSSTLSDASDGFLKVIPETMDYIVAMSVKGQNFVKLPQIGQLIKLFKGIPYFGRLDMESMLSTIDGPVAAGMAHDVNTDEWNAVIAAKSTNPDAILNHISKFASSFGQAPEIYNGEYIYQYDDKMIKLGINEGVLYIKMLNYEQTEGYAYDKPEVKEAFANSPIAFFINASSGTNGGCFSLGLTNKKSIKGQFTPSSKDSNVVVAMLQVLCGIKPAMLFDDVESDTYMPSAIDELKPVN